MEDIARKIFAKAKYQATEEDIKRLSNNMTLLKARELGNLNQRLIEGGRGIWDTIAEHNFAVGLCSLQDPTITIRYEPSEGLQRRPDFKIGKGSITYWIQMKKLVPLGRENRQNKIIEQIKRETKDIKIKKFFSCDLSSDFTHSDVSELVKFITNTADSSLEGKDYFFQYDNEQKARVDLIGE